MHRLPDPTARTTPTCQDQTRNTPPIAPWQGYSRRTLPPPPRGENRPRDSNTPGCYAICELVYDYDYDPWTMSTDQGYSAAKEAKERA